MPDAGTGLDTPDASEAFCDGTPYVCPANAICDDFEDITSSDFPGVQRESGTVSQTNWMTGMPASAASSIGPGTTACRGGKSLHFTATGAAQSLKLAYGFSTIPRPTSLYARVFMRIASSSPGSDFETMGMQRASDGKFISFGFTHDKVLVDSPDLRDLNEDTGIAGPLERNAWMCIRMHVIFDAGANGVLELSIDDVPVVTIRGATDLTPGFDRFQLTTVTGADETGVFDVDYDSLVIADHDISCYP